MGDGDLVELGAGLEIALLNLFFANAFSKSFRTRLLEVLEAVEDVGV